MAQVMTRIDGDSISRRIYIGIAGTGDNAVVLETGDVSDLDTFTLMSTAGAFDVYASLDGTNFATAPLSMSDLGATVSAPVLVAAAARIYGFAGPFKAIRILQAGATPVANLTMLGKRTSS